MIGNEHLDFYNNLKCVKILKTKEREQNRPQI